MHWLYSFWGSIEFSPNENKINLWVTGSSTRGEFSFFFSLKVLLL